jgi:hypothetical protein
MEEDDLLGGELKELDLRHQLQRGAVEVLVYLIGGGVSKAEE